jgi:hypothetical protein
MMGKVLRVAGGVLLAGLGLAFLGAVSTANPLLGGLAVIGCMLALCFWAGTAWGRRKPAAEVARLTHEAAGLRAALAENIRRRDALEARLDRLVGVNAEAVA